MSSESPQLCLGLFVLLLVDIIWVASSELSEYIFKDSGFNKPFFSTYLKTSLFSIYLIGFAVWPPWRHQCKYIDDGSYTRLARDDLDEDEEDANRLSSPHYERVKMSDESSKCSDSETESNKTDSNRSVRFNDVAEVRQMPQSDGMEALMSRLSFSASQRVQQQLHNLRTAALPIRRVMEVALYFCFLWFLGNYSYQMALSLSHTGIVNVVSSTSGLFTLILAAIFPSAATDSFTLSKFCTVIAMLVGVTMVSMEDMYQSSNSSHINVSSELLQTDVLARMSQQPLYSYNHHISVRELLDDSLQNISLINISDDDHKPVYKTFMGTVESSNASSEVVSPGTMLKNTTTRGAAESSADAQLLDLTKLNVSGAVWALCGALLYACYMVFLRRAVKNEEEVDIPMFFGFVGLFNTLFWWPFLLLLHVLGWEVFLLPTKQQLLYILVNGLVGTVLSELLWIWGCFLTSSLLATLSLSLTIPLSMLCDIFLRGVTYSWLFYAGTLPIVLSFIAVTLLTHYDNCDPIGRLCCCCCRAAGSRESTPPHSEMESESLIVSAEDYEDPESFSCDDNVEINESVPEEPEEAEDYSIEDAEHQVQTDLIDISPSSTNTSTEQLLMEAKNREIFKAEVISALEPCTPQGAPLGAPEASSSEHWVSRSQEAGSLMPQSNNIALRMWASSDSSRGTLPQTGGEEEVLPLRRMTREPSRSGDTVINKHSKNILNTNTKHLHQQKLQIQFNNLLSDHVKHDLVPAGDAPIPLPTSSHSNNLPILDLRNIESKQTYAEEPTNLLDCTKLDLMAKFNSQTGYGSDVYLAEEEETLQIIKHGDSDVITSQLVTSNVV